MHRIRVLIGPFRRRVFTEGLASLLKDESDIEVDLINDELEIERLMESPTPLVVILEHREQEERSAFRPRSDAVALIMVSAEQQDLRILLGRANRHRICAAIRLVAAGPRSRMISLDVAPLAQAPFALPQFRHAETSGLSHVIAWLDAVFACALSELAAQRESEVVAGWIGDLKQLVQGFSPDGKTSHEDEARCFDALVAAPGRHTKPFRLFELDPSELKLLCLVAAPDLDQRYAQAIGILQNDYATPRPNATTLARLIDAAGLGADIRALMAGRRAFARLRMIRVDDSDIPQPSYRVAPDLLAMMIGARDEGDPPPRLEHEALPAEDDLAAEIAEILVAPGPTVVMALGDGPAVGDELAAAVMAAGVKALRVDGAALGGEARHAVTDFALRACLDEAVLIIDNAEALSPRCQAAVLNADALSMVRGVIVVGNPPPGLLGDALVVRVEKPSMTLLARRWSVAAESQGLTLSAEGARRLGATLRLPMADIETVARLAAGRRRMDADAADEVLLLEAARTVSTRHAPETVRRAPSIFTWNDIVLPRTIKRQVARIAEHVKHSSQVLDDWDFASRLPYGRGIGVLFSGPSGTGKTMCAQVIARELGVELMQVEISRCVSKYIGETEKNIDRCFAAAEAASAVLLFDEADALFGKRTEIKDAHDRHANVEVAYLLQRIEAYEGLVILTTNIKTNIDAAFLRRLRFVVDFPMPDAADRERIWQVAVPEAAPCAADVEIAFLARRLPLSGGSIQSIAVNAAFDAAAERCDRIHMRHVMAATRAELLKHGMFNAEKALDDTGVHALDGAAP